jgi:hypothetical protein
MAVGKIGNWRIWTPIDLTKADMNKLENRAKAILQGIRNVGLEWRTRLNQGKARIEPTQISAWDQSPSQATARNFLSALSENMGLPKKHDRALECMGSLLKMIEAGIVERHQVVRILDALIKGLDDTQLHQLRKNADLLLEDYAVRPGSPNLLNIVYKRCDVRLMKERGFGHHSLKEPIPILDQAEGDRRAQVRTQLLMEEDPELYAESPESPLEGPPAYPPPPADEPAPPTDIHLAPVDLLLPPLSSVTVSISRDDAPAPAEVRPSNEAGMKAAQRGHQRVDSHDIRTQPKFPFLRPRGVTASTNGKDAK